jgi:hypothetical protein
MFGWKPSDMNLWVTSVELSKSRSVVGLASQGRDATMGGWLFSPARAAEVRPPGLQGPPDIEADYIDAYLTDEHGNVSEFVATASDYARRMQNGFSRYWYAHEVRPNEMYHFNVEFKPVGIDATRLTLYHRQFGTTDIPLEDATAKQPEK